MYLGVEIGGTKLQLAVGKGEGEEPAAFERFDVDPARGAAGILEHIERCGSSWMRSFPLRAVGIGFGGPVASSTGRTVKSHQIEGWTDFPLGPWCQKAFDLPVALGNDCDCAALAEALFGAGKGKRSVFFVTVGTGVGGGFVVDQRNFGADRPAIAEIGHLRPGLSHNRPDMTVESLASGWGIAAAAVARITGQVSRPLPRRRPEESGAASRSARARLLDSDQAEQEFIADLRQRCDNDPELLTARIVAQAAAEGNDIAREVLAQACQALGWAVAQVVTLTAPEVIVIGGGVSLMGEAQFFAPVRKAAQEYVFPPLADSYQIVPAALGESVVVHGALRLARNTYPPATVP